MKTTLDIPNKSQPSTEEVYLKKNIWVSKYASRLMKVEDPSSKTAKVRIFLVDDDPIFLKALEHAIDEVPTDKKIVVQSFLNGEECLPFLDTHPTIVFLDYYLDSNRPNAINGIEVLKKINQISPHTKVVMLSSQNDVSVVLKSIKLHVYGYIIKDKNTFIATKKIIKKMLHDLVVEEYVAKDKRRNLTINVILIIALIALFFFSRMIQ